MCSQADEAARMLISMSIENAKKPRHELFFRAEWDFLLFFEGRLKP